MPSHSTEAELLTTIELVVRRYCEHFEITNTQERADIITRVLLMFEQGTTDEVELMAKLLEVDEKAKLSDEL